MLFFDTALASQSKQSKQSKLVLAGSNIQPHKKHISASVAIYRNHADFAYNIQLTTHAPLVELALEVYTSARLLLQLL